MIFEYKYMFNTLIIFEIQKTHCENINFNAIPEYAKFPYTHVFLYKTCGSFVK